MSWIWDMEAGSAKPTFIDEQQANRIMSLIMRHYNSVVGASNTYPASFEPLFWRDACWGAAEWCEGFVLGLQLNAQAWNHLTAVHPSWLTPFLRLGTEDGDMITERAKDADKWISKALED